MKEKIIKITVILIVLVILILASTVAYFMIADIETNIIPNESAYTCNIEQRDFMNRNVFILTPKNVEKTDLVILYFHGGSYMAEITNEHWNFLEKVINNTGATVILPDYPLSPKHNYKDVFNMVEPLYNAIVSKIDTNNFIVMGDSAGGGLALALEEKIVNDAEENQNNENKENNNENINYKLPKKTILISPWLDVRLENSKIDEVQKLDKDLNKETLKLAGIAYAGTDGINSYLVNPIDGDLSKLNNITIFTGTNDILNPDVHVLEEKAENQGITINIREYEGAYNIYILKNNKKEKDLISQGLHDLIETLKTN